MDRLPVEVLTLILKQLELHPERATIGKFGQYSLINKTFFDLCQPWIWEGLDLTEIDNDKVAYFVTHLAPRFGSHVKTLVLRSSATGNGLNGIAVSDPAPTAESELIVCGGGMKNGTAVLPE